MGTKVETRDVAVTEAKEVKPLSSVKVAQAFLSVDPDKVDKGQAVAFLSSALAGSDDKGEGRAADETAISDAAAALARLKADAREREAKRGEARVAFSVAVFALTSRKILAGKEIAQGLGVSGARISQAASDGRRMVALGSTSPDTLATLVAARKRSAGEADAIVAKSLALTPAPVSDKPDARPRPVRVAAATVREVAATVNADDAPAPTVGRARGTVSLGAQADKITAMHEAMTDAPRVIATEADRERLLNVLARYAAAVKSLDI